MKIPKMSQFEVNKILASAGVDLSIEFAAILGIRGYYKRTMGDPDRNDRNIYDDAFFVTAPGVFFATIGNTDPSIYRPGVAVLVPGVYDCVKHRHKGQYAALQIVLDRLLRDGSKKIDVGRHGINFHYGSIARTGSLGCQTMPKPNFQTFQPMVYRLMDHYGKERIKYALIDN